jgi:hypothetical protein
MTKHETPWRKASHSVNAQNCVELAGHGDGVLLRNSNRLGDGTLVLTPAELAAFVDGCRAGEFDDLVVRRPPAAGERRSR